MTHPWSRDMNVVPHSVQTALLGPRKRSWSRSLSR
jgi:hypothetical protein